MSALTLQRCTDQTAWDEFLSKSPQASLYCTQGVIDALGCKAEYWFVMRNGYPVAGIPVITDNRAADGLPIHSYYAGLMLHTEAWDCKHNRRTENLLAICEHSMAELSHHYDEIELCLHPSITDIRGFDWFNYHTPENGRVAINPRYSAQIILDADHIRTTSRGSRRREENYARERESLHGSFDGNADELIHLWQHSLQRQDNTLTDTELEITNDFANYLLDNGLGIIATTRNENGDAVSAGLIMFDYNKLAHLPVVGTSDTRYGGTLLYFTMMDYAAEQGYELMDFNGANSPARGYFKHSIGGEATLYFHIKWNRP